MLSINTRYNNIFFQLVTRASSRKTVLEFTKLIKVPFPTSLFTYHMQNYRFKFYNKICDVELYFFD